MRPPGCAASEGLCAFLVLSLLSQADARFISVDEVSRNDREIDIGSNQNEFNNRVLLKRLLRRLTEGTSFAAPLLVLTEGGKFADERAAAQWMNEYSLNVTQANQEIAIASWVYSTNISQETAQQKSEVTLKWLPTLQEGNRQAKSFFRYQQAFGNQTLKRMLKTEALCGSVKSSNDQLREKLGNRLEGIYGKATIDRVNDKGQMETLAIEPGITDLMAKSRDYDELKWAWIGWRNVSGRLMRKDFIDLIKLQNDATRNAGNYKDQGAEWRACAFEEPDKKNSSNKYLFVKEMAKDLFEQIKPLYEELHAYVRYKLRNYYSSHFRGPFADENSPIPAHLFGNMWAQQWPNIFDILKPFPNMADTDVTNEMKSQGWTVHKMFRTAESFFTSLGLEPMTDKFWNRSMLTKPEGREVVCHASAEDFFKQDDFRIKMCAEVNQVNLETVHHEMGHIEYFMQYRHQPALFRGGANSAFHEAVGDTIALSVMTPGHLVDLKLLPKEQAVPSYEQTMNFLMKTALSKVAFLPFGYMIDKWRWDVYSGEIPEENLNRMWWKYRIQLQGIAPPVNRSEDDFDPGAKYHVAAFVPYVRYFYSFILQFQFHMNLCSKKGHDLTKLHTCDIYGSEKAGKALREMLQKGSSQYWADTLEQFTGMRKFDTTAILSYFRPLEKYLQDYRKTEGYAIGWKTSINQFFRT